MRMITADLFVSQDDVVESPTQMGYQHGGDQMWEEIAVGIARSDSVLRIHLFEDMPDRLRLKLMESMTFSTGMVGVTYQRETA